MNCVPRTLAAAVLALLFASHAHARQCHVTKLTADDAVAKSSFGYTVAIDGDDIVVGAPLDDPNRRNSGSAYVLHRDGLNWYCQAKLIPSDAARGKVFGMRVAIDGDTVAVAASRAEFASDGDPGAVYVFERQGKNWLEVAKLLPIPPRSLEYLYGFSLAVRGDWIFVGEPRDPTGGRDAGAIHSYRRTALGWEAAGRILPTDLEPVDQFGDGLAVSGDTLVAGAALESTQGAFAGAAYVFERVGDAWQQTAKLLSSDGTAGDIFGASVAIDHDTLLVGAPGQGRHAGGAYVFERTAGGWTEGAKLSPLGLLRGNNLGISTAVSGDSLLVSAPFRSPNGVVFLYRRELGLWTLVDEWEPSDAQLTRNDWFGWPIAASGDLIALGSRNHDQRDLDAGAVYVESLSGSLCATLSSPRELSWGKQEFLLDHGPAHAGHSYWLLGSISGTSPGSRYQGVRLPLNPDFYMGALARRPNQNVFANNMGVLDANGRARCVLEVPLSVYTHFVGIDMDHAFLEFDSAGAVEHVSNAVSLRFGKRN